MTSESQAIWAALAAVQTVLKSQQHTREVKVSTNKGTYAYTYTELSALADYLLPILGAAGIATTYTSRLTGTDALEIECRLTAADGSHVEASTFIQPQSWSAQDVGKVETYGRRYTLQMVTGIATEADDDCAQDGAKHSEVKTASRQNEVKAQVSATSQNAPSEMQRKKLWAQINGIVGDAPREEIKMHLEAACKRVNGCTLYELDARKASGLISWLETATIAMLNDDIPFGRK